ncbi:ABC transporter permease [Halogeometricum borinquense]|uniref:ABC transporter permease n=1 Tax=Halogeometricum borinquense TaxID=60847 RepID=A0A6C0UJS6_9EURY|nr:ABC transporter permease [Halogeometricum borinquense]QIB75467.1 ABC transporter permease [Halogeometricum borinquense]
MATEFDRGGESDGSRASSARQMLFGRESERKRISRGVLGTGCFLALWWLAGRTQPSYLLPTPPEVGLALWTELTSGELFVHLGQSLLHYVPGVVVGVTVGSAVGIAVGWSDALDDACTPIIRILRPIPPLAWIVFAIIWFGLGHSGAAFIVFIGAFWITFYNAYSGVESASRELMEVAETLGVDTDWRLIRRVVLPDATPELLTGLRTSVGQCWMMVIAAELFGAPGVGYEIITSSNNLATERSVAYMLTISAVFLVSDWGVRRLEARLLAWRQ